MRIAYLLTEFPGLTETFVVTECELLRKAGLEVIPYSFRPASYPDLRTPLATAWAARTQRPSRLSPLALGRAWVGQHKRARAAIDILTSHRAADWRERLGGWGALPWCATVAEDLQQRGVDHIHAHFARGAATLAWMTSTLSNIPFSFTAHAFGVHRSTPSALRRKCEAAAFVRATHRSFGDRLPNAIHIPTPLLLDELPFKAPHTPGSALQVVTVARLVPKKGIDLLPALRDQLRKAGISAEFTVIGPGDTAAYQAPGIRCRGPLSHQEALKSIQEADLYLQPCRIAPDGDRDGLPVSLLEAFALGTPSVATRVAGIPELFPDALSHQLAPADNVDALAQIMTGLWARPQRWAEIARSQRSVVEQRFGPCAVDALIGRFERHRCG